MKVSAKLNYIRISPRKVRIMVSLIKGLGSHEAVSQLERTVKRSSVPLKKLLQSAMHNGENNFGIDKDNMYVHEVKVGEGPTLKRWMPRAFGRAAQIRKRTSKIEIILDEIIEGAGRKTKEQMEEEKKKRMAEKEKREQALRREQEQAQKESKQSISGALDKKKEERELKKDQNTSGKKSWVSRVFRRKSM